MSGTASCFSFLRPVPSAFFKAFTDDFQKCLSLESDRGLGGSDGLSLGRRGGALIGGFLTNQHKISSNRVVALCLTFAAVMAAILASQVLSGYWAVVLMCLMGLGTGVAAPSRDIMIRGATVAKLGKKSFGLRLRLYLLRNGCRSVSDTDFLWTAS